MFERGSRGRGGNADVVLATLIRKGGSEGESTELAVKKFRFILSDEMTEESFLPVSSSPYLVGLDMRPTGSALQVFANELRVLDQ